MIKHLLIKNFALIDDLEIDFFEGFSVITGETGAGKSIVIGAISLILGKRADLQSLKNKSEKCVVEGNFSVNKTKFESFFSQNDLDFDPGNTILRREILPSGKSRAFINDTPVSLTQLRELADQVLDLHSQNSTTLLQSSSFQLAVVDHFCKNAQLLKGYSKVFDQYQQLTSKVEQLRQSEKISETEQDFFKFQYEELEKSELRPGEQEEIEEELKVLNNADEIKTRLSAVTNLVEGEHGMNSIFDNILSEIKPIKNISRELTEMYSRIDSTFVEFSDVARELMKIDEVIEVNPQRSDELTGRINLIYHLEQKHRVNGIDELIKIKDSYLGKIEQHQSVSSEIQEIEKQLAKIKSQLTGMADELSTKRKLAIPDIESQVTGKISGLGMPDAKIVLKLQKTEGLAYNGADRVSFMFNANKGGELQEMAKVASGGELSRLMLAIKSQIATGNLVSSIIFDEIDSGVSGEIAGKMAAIMQTLAKEIQVISITHLPQIAARGHHHYLVTKDSDEHSTTTYVKQLTEKDRVVEIAKMLSDTKISNSALQTAQELLGN